MTDRYVTLTDEQLREKTARELLDLLENISADGVLTGSEIVKLSEWLENAAKTDLPALAYLRAVFGSVLTDRVVIADERKAIVAAIVRVMPSERSELAKLRFRDAENHEKSQFVDEWNDPDKRASAEQIQCLQAMGLKIEKDCTFARAEETIAENLRDTSPATDRQKAMLRFWNMSALATKNCGEIDEWLDNFYAEDPDRLAAWELGQTPNASDTNPALHENNGEFYLERIKTASRTQPEMPLAYRIAMGIIAIILIAIIAYGFHKAGQHP